MAGQLGCLQIIATPVADSGIITVDGRKVGTVHVQRAPLSELLSQQPNQSDLYAAGIQKLKQGMWNNLGVDYSQYGKFDDSPTSQQVQRSSPLGGLGTADYLRTQQNLMEQEQTHGEPGVDYPTKDLFPWGARREPKQTI